MSEYKLKCKEDLKKLSALEDSIKDTDVKNEIMELVTLANKIMRFSKEKDIDKLKNFYKYYIPESIKIVKAFKDIEQSGLMLESVNNLKNEIKKALETTNKGLTKLLESILKDDFFELKAQMKVLESELKFDGLLEEKI